MKHSRKGTCSVCRQFHPNLWRLSSVRVAFIRVRDGENCGICGLPVLFDVPPLHPAFASVDHVEPRARGGKNCPDNLRLAHRWCNMKRNDDGPATKLRLRGCAGHMRKVLERPLSVC